MCITYINLYRLNLTTQIGEIAFQKKNYRHNFLKIIPHIKYLIPRAIVAIIPAVGSGYNRMSLITEYLRTEEAPDYLRSVRNGIFVNSENIIESLHNLIEKP